MKSDVIGEILQVEDTAQKIIEDGGNESRAIIQEAQGEAARMIREAGEKARAEGNALVDEAEKQYQLHLSEYEERQQQLNNGKASLDPAVVKEAAGRIISTITKTEIFGA